MVPPFEEKYLIVKCDCGSEALEVQYWLNDDAKNKYPDEFYFAFWHYGFERPLCWRERLRWCWRILRTGNPWADSILVFPTKAKQIADFINENISNEKTTK